MKSMIFDQSSAMSDPNNNMGASSNKKSNEKYSLRQRQKRETNPRHGNSAGRAGDTSSSAATLSDLSCDHEPVAKEKPKSKPAPLSKYRRKTANARERTRMREINSAFENLRSCVPHCIGGADQQSPANEKLTKITTLRLAMKYIQTLSDALMDPSHDTSFLYGPNISDGSFINNNNDQADNNNFNAMDVLYSSGTESSTPSPIKVKTTAVKTQNRARQKTKQKFTEAFGTINNSVASMSPTIDYNPADLGLLLESDGESLHLSEPCLSPLGHHMKPFGCNPTDSALELGLILESDNESLQFSEPCLSPLGALDSFHPFDLLHTEFSEQTSLDMYLT